MALRNYNNNSDSSLPSLRAAHAVNQPMHVGTLCWRLYLHSPMVSPRYLVRHVLFSATELVDEDTRAS